MDLDQDVREELVKLLKPYCVSLVAPVVLDCPGPSQERLVVLSPWRGYLVTNKLPVVVENTFSYLEICSIHVHAPSQVVLETDRLTLSFSASRINDVEAIVSHMTTSLKKVYPHSSPGKLLKAAPPGLVQRIQTAMALVQEKQSSSPRHCGGFSESYAALCDLNETPFREEIQWDVDNIYSKHGCRQFNLRDFSHLDSRDLALAISALTFNQWFTKISSKELRLSEEVQQQLMFLLSRSPGLQHLSLEASGLRVDFAVNMAAALRENSSSALRSINLGGNAIEDKGVVALSQQLKNLKEGLEHLSLSRVQMTARGLGFLSRALSSTRRSSLTLLDLSANPNSLTSPDATFLFQFLSESNHLTHLDLSHTGCPLDTLFVSLSAGCHKLIHLNLARNPFSYRKVRRVTKSLEEFFSRSSQLKFVCLSGTRLPPQALRLILQGLAVNPDLSGLELDVSSCELRSSGAMVIQEHISEAAAIASLNISDNKLENDMVTLVLSLAQCKSLRRLELGRNFTMKSRALRDVLHRLAQLLQDEECPLQSLSVCDSKLKSGTDVLLSALGGHVGLVELDISGNEIGDVGAKMLAKALMTNSRLKTLHWDRNNVTARGFQDVADALEWNATLQQVPLPLADITQSYRGNPDATRDALLKIQMCLDRNQQRRPDDHHDHQLPAREPLDTQMLHGLYQQLQDDLRHVNHQNLQEAQDQVVQVQQVLQKVLKLLPSLRNRDVDSSSDGGPISLGVAVAALTDQLTTRLQDFAEGLLGDVEWACPRLVQRSSVCEKVWECVSSRTRELQVFVRNSMEDAGRMVQKRVQELKGLLRVTLADGLEEQVLQELLVARHKLDSLLNASTTQGDQAPDLLDPPQDDYVPAVWRNTSRRPATSLKSLLVDDLEKRGGGRPEEEDGATEEGVEARHSLRLLLTATPLSLKSPSHSPLPSPSPPGGRGSGRKEGEAADAAEAISVWRAPSFTPPPGPPLPRSIPALKVEAAGRRGSPPPEAPSAGRRSGSPASPMEPLPTQGQTLRHYTASRPRPRRKHTQPPSSRPQESESKVENEAGEAMGRVDEGVEEFFTKRIIPGYTLKGRWEESNPAQATPSESSSTPSVSTPFSSQSDIIPPSVTASGDSPALASSAIPPPSTDVPPVCTPPTPPSVAAPTTTPPKNIKKKFGDFFVFKRARAGRAAKAGGGEGGGGEGVKVKRTSIADLIRPLREAKERERERGRGKEREKEERGARSEEDVNLSHDAAMTEGTIATALPLAGDVKEKMAATTTPPSDVTPSQLATSPERATAPLSNLVEDVGPSLGLGVVTPRTEPERQFVKSPYGERKLKVTRTLREGKSQSLILLTGLETDDKDGMASKKHASESGFEQRLQVMLHRVGVAKTHPADAKTSQKIDEELRKANSEGAILDKPAPPPSCLQPRTMSTSSADPRHPPRALEPTRPEPVLNQKPALAERPPGPLPPRPVVAAKPPVIAAPAGGAEQDTAVQNCNHESPQGAPSSLSPQKEALPSAPWPWRAPPPLDRTGKAQSVTDESLPQTRIHVKPLQQRRAVSVHEDALAMTQELKAVLQKSPVRFGGTRSDSPFCLGNQSICEEAQRAQARGSPTDAALVDSGGTSTGGPVVKTTRLSPGSAHPIIPAPADREASRTVAVPAASAEPDSSLARTPDLVKHRKSPSRAAPQTLQHPHVSPSSPNKTPGTSPSATESSEVKPLSPRASGPDPADLGTGTPQRAEAVEPAHQRTEPLLSD